MHEPRAAPVSGGRVVNGPTVDHPTDGREPCGFGCGGCGYCADLPDDLPDPTQGGEMLGREWAVVNDATADAYLVGLVEQISALTAELQTAVGVVKLGGWSWARIAQCLSSGVTGKAGKTDQFGATKQAAAARFAKSAPQVAELLAAAAWDDEAHTEWRRLTRRLGVRPARLVYVVREGDKRTGRKVSAHYSPERADEAAARCGGSVWIVDPRPTVRDRLA